MQPLCLRPAPFCDLIVTLAGGERPVTVGPEPSLDAGGPGEGRDTSSLGANGVSLHPKEASSSAGGAVWGPGTWTPAQAFSALGLTLREAA